MYNIGVSSYFIFANIYTLFIYICTLLNISWATFHQQKI